MSEVVHGWVSPPLSSEQKSGETAAPVVERSVGDVGLADLKVFPTSSHAEGVFRSERQPGGGAFRAHNDEVADGPACELKIAGDFHYARRDFERASDAYQQALVHVLPQGYVWANLTWNSAKANIERACGQKGAARQASLAEALRGCLSARDVYAANAFACAALENDIARARELYARTASI